MINQGDLVQALRAAGVEPGMTVFSHANIAFFGRVEGADSMDDLIRITLKSFAKALGPDGTLVLPVFTYSFGSDKQDKVFDLQNTLSTTSGMGNWLIMSGNGVRSADPMLSVVATGSKAEALTADIDTVCFGSKSIWARLHSEDALICNLNFDSGSTYLHWVERGLGVPYRSDISMSGSIIDGGQARTAQIVYSGRSLEDQRAMPKFEAYHAACLAHGVSTCIALGRGQIVAQQARAAKNFLESQMVENPYILTARHSG